MGNGSKDLSSEQGTGCFIFHPISPPPFCFFSLKVYSAVASLSSKYFIGFRHQKEIVWDVGERTFTSPTPFASLLELSTYLAVSDYCFSLCLFLLLRSRLQHPGEHGAAVLHGR